MSNESAGIEPGQILLPLTLVSCAVLGLLVFNTVQIVQSHETLKQVISQQDKPLEESKKIENQLTALALGTKRLADSGNGNAQGIVDAMQKAGITINDQQQTGVLGGANRRPAAVAPAPAENRVAPPAPEAPLPPPSQP